MMKSMFLYQCDYSFHDLLLDEHIFPSITHPVFQNHNTALVIMIDSLNIARVATARLLI